jgi:cellulose biosynthesis protein BcsQ
MSVPVLTFFNNKGGVGKTLLVYHLAWMFSMSGQRVMAIDLDPQTNLTAAFLDDEAIEAVWDKSNSTIFQCVKPLTEVGDILEPDPIKIEENLYLLSGDVALSGYEDVLAGAWPDSMGSENLYRPMRILSSFWQVMQMAARKTEADILLVDIGPNLGAINRSVLIATNYVVIPLAADLFSLRGLQNLGPTLLRWKQDWKKRLDNWAEASFTLPEGKMTPLGYLCQQYGTRLEHPVKAYEKWMRRIPETYRKCMLQEATGNGNMTPENDVYCLGTIKHYRSLVPMAQEQRKPIFNLLSADGAIGSHALAVQDAKKDFRRLSEKIMAKIKSAC